MRKDVALVVPTIRENSFTEFLNRWKNVGLFDQVDLLVMEDNPTKTFDIPSSLLEDTSVHWFTWETIEDHLKEKSWIIPRRSDTVRSFAYWKAWQMGYKYIVTLDDDCYPNSEAEGRSFIDDHLSAFDGKSRWFNTLNNVIPRGIPYYNRGINNKVIVNHGLWTNVVDYDAPRQLVAPIPEKYSYDSKLVPNGSYFPMCGMNVMWRADATVLMYHLLMGQTIIDGILPSHPAGLSKLPFDRFGDIWCGILMKKIADTMGYNVSSGTPYIRHERASNPFTNLKKEANGLEVNEKFWEHVDKWTNVAKLDELQMLYADMGVYIRSYEEFPEHSAYFKKLGMAMVTWASLFNKENKWTQEG